MSSEFQALSNLEYHADTSHLSSSGLKLLLKSTQEFYRKYILGEGANEEKDAFSEGSFVHALILEPETISSAFAIFPGMRKAGAAWDTFKAENTGKILLSAPQVLRCERLAKAHAALQISVDLITGGFAEHALVTELLGVKLKMRADYINVDKAYIVDVKTTSMPSDVELFRQTVTQYGYDLSAALYCAIASANFNKDFDFYFIVLSKADNQCNVYKLSNKSRTQGYAKVLEALQLYKMCIATGVWEHKGIKEQRFNEKEYEVLDV